jgi:hypothetical protein
MFLAPTWHDAASSISMSFAVASKIDGKFLEAMFDDFAVALSQSLVNLETLDEFEISISQIHTSEPKIHCVGVHDSCARQALSHVRGERPKGMPTPHSW